MCHAAESIKQCERIAAIPGYIPNNFALCDDFDLRYDDSIVTKVLEVIKQESIDTLITIWPFDAHPTHRAASQIALAASRKVPRILLTKISWNSVPHAYKHNYFVDIKPAII